MQLLRVFCACACFALCHGPMEACAREPIDFSRDVLPILSDKCFQCHGPDAEVAREGDLRLDDEHDVKRERDGHWVVSPGDLNASELYLRISSGDADQRMPPPELGRGLSSDDLAILRDWIVEGAKWGRHWAFERIERPVLPIDSLRGQSSRHPVDLLVGRQLSRQGVEPNGRAGRPTLLRRLKLDLTGLPPTTAQRESFLADREPGAWIRLVDQTLASPAYGERMAWDWLEAARYADSNGYQGDRERTMWPWRDWVVRAFNENLSFDAFTIWQLAGDLLPAASSEQILATGFCRNHMINGEGGRIAEENRVDYVMDMTETMGTVWLGLTLNCCRCHDHKFDPLLQREYYQLTAFFNQTPVDGKGGDPQTAPVLEVPSQPQTESLRAARQELSEMNARIDTRREELRGGQALWEQAAVQLESGQDASLIAALKVVAEQRTDEQRKLISEAFFAADEDLQEMEQRKSAAASKLKKLQESIPKVMVMEDRLERRPTFILERGLYNQPREEVVADVPHALPILKGAEETTRLELARWLVSREQPLTARVAVNRIWQMLFGVGLVKTTEDFGVQGEYPVQRELLDWLAAEFIDSGWDTKHLIRHIVTSQTYQRSSVIPSAERFEMDPENRLLSRGPRYRLPSWMIRDQALAVAGLLNSEMGGPAVYPYQPEGIWSEATFGKKTYERSEGQELYRRSVYTFWRRIVGPPLFFDAAKRQVCEVKPLRTNTPMHALATFNDITFVEAAKVLAVDLLSVELDETQRLQRVARQVLCRELSAQELGIWNRSWKRAHNHFREDPSAASNLLQQGDWRLPDEWNVAEQAAWTLVCLNFLNLDETLSKE